LSLIARAGGAAWFQWFAFPFAFILTAVPWPHTLESIVSDSLMRGTAGATVETLCLIGVPSAQVGNLVHIENGVLDIDEACSGIRSLQAMVMISLFLGELFRLTLARRLLLMVLGLSVTLLANVVRTVTLSSIGFGQGMSAVDRYHDAAGLSVLLFSLSSTLVAAFLLRPRQTPEPVPDPDIPVIELTFPLGLSSALLLWFFVEEVSIEAWYRAHEPKWQGWSWAVEWPQQSEGFHFTEIPKRSLALLMCDQSMAAAWKEPDGTDWSTFWLRWNPGNPAAEAAKVHRPDVCLNAEGALMEKDMGVHLNTVGGLQMPFHSYLFRMGEKPLYVFFCLYEEIPGVANTSATARFEATDMFERALKGRRHIGQQTLELAIVDARSEQSALQAFQARLGQLIKVIHAPPL
jgi:exosortase/archaeosortase family protein